MTRRLSDVAELDWAAYVRPGDRVVWGQACAEPRSLTESLMASRETVGRFTCFLGVPAGDTCRPEHGDLVSFEAYTAAGSNRDLWRAGCLDILPVPYSSLPSLFRTRRLPVDVLLLLVPPPVGPGRYALGLAEEHLTAAVDSARTVIAEVSEAVPRVPGSRFLTDDDLDVVVHTQRPPARLMHPAPTTAQLAIGAHVAGLVEDGSTLQVGIGALPDAVVRSLSQHRDLGVHSGGFTDSMAHLSELGVITNGRKTVDAGAAVAGVVMGGNVVLDHVGRHPTVQLRPTDYTHDPSVLAAQHKLVALNAALEVDLDGQVNAEVANGTYVGAYGGACELAAGARRSRGGMSVVLLPSTASERSRIVPSLSGPVSTPRGEVDVVVTEYGAADLRGLTTERRRRALIDVAHPAHREALERWDPPWS